jgi:ABC-type transporter MlaC component
MWLKVLAWFRKNWAKVAGVLALIGAYFLGASAKKTSPDKEQIRKEHQAIKKAIAQEEAEYKRKQAEIDKSVKDKDDRLDKLTKKFGNILLIGLVILFAAASPVKAETAQIPYDTLVTLYNQALDKIAEQAAYIKELESGLREAVDLAKGYRSDWAAQKQLTLNAHEMIAYLKAFIESQEKIIEKQWTIIDRLTANRLTLSIGAELARDEEGKLEVKPKAALEFVVR